MKVAIVSYGHLDSIIPQSKALSDHASVDLFMIFAMNKLRESVLSLEDKGVTTGFQNEETTSNILGNNIEEFIDNRFTAHFFVYQNLKLKSMTNFKLSRQLAKKLREYDVVHFNGQDGTLLQLMPLLIGVKKVFTVHDFVRHTGEGKKNLMDRFNPWLINSGKQVVIQNKEDYNRLVADDPNQDHIHFVPFGPLDIFQAFDTNEDQGLPESELLFFGRISEYKGIEYLLDALEILEKKGKKIQTLIAGSGGYDFGKKRIEGKDYIQLINRFIGNDELTEMIKKTNIVVCPYTDASQSGVAMTSYVFNKPVIASAVGGFPDVVKEGVTGWLVPPKNAESLAVAIENAMADRPALRQSEQNIKNMKERGAFSWNEIGKALHKVYLQQLK